MRILIAALLLGSSPTPAKEVQNPPSTDQERTNARRGYWDCLLSKAMELDDGISSADQIAAAIQPLCANEVHKVAETSTRGMKRSWRLYELLLQELQTDKKTATQAVLIARKGLAEATERPR